MMTVRSISVRPVRGSVSSGNSRSVSTTSPARSPQAARTTMSTSAWRLVTCWTRAEGAGDAVGAAEGDGEEGVDDALLRHHRLRRAQALDVAREGNLDGPALNHRHLALVARLVGDDRDLVRDLVVALGGDVLHGPGAGKREGNHDPVLENALRDGAERFAGRQLVADLRGRREAPGLFARERIEVGAALEEEAALLGEARKRVLEAVEDLAEKAGAEFGGKEVARERDGVADLEAGGVLEDLHVGARAADADDFAHEPARLAVGPRGELGVADLVLGDGALEGHGNHVAVDHRDFAFGSHTLSDLGN